MLYFTDPELKIFSEEDMMEWFYRWGLRLGLTYVSLITVVLAVVNYHKIFRSQIKLRSPANLDKTPSILLISNKVQARLLRIHLGTVLPHPD